MPTSSPRRRRPYAARVPLEQRREQLMDAALDLIVRDGYRSVTVEAVAQAAGVTKPVVYGAYDGLDPLLTALLDRQQARALQQLLDALPSDAGSDPGEFSSRTVRAWVAVVTSDPQTWSPILLAYEGTPAAVWHHIELGRVVLRDRLAGLLRTQLPGDGPVDPELLAHALIAVAEHFGRMLLSEPEQVDVDRLDATVRTIVEATIGQAVQSRIEVRALQEEPDA